MYKLLINFLAIIGAICLVEYIRHTFAYETSKEMIQDGEMNK